MLKFENGDSLGATYVHPIFTNEGWKAAGEIKSGESILCYDGYHKVISNQHLEGTHKVYNLEVKDLHNFLVGDVGVVVHNSYADFIKGIWSSFTKKPFPTKKWVSYILESGNKDENDKEIIQLEELGEHLKRSFISLNKDSNGKDFPTIDGLFEDDGIGISLKKLQAGSGANKVATAASTILANIESNFKNQNSHKNNHVKKGIIAYIDASEHNAAKILEQIQKTRNANDKNYARYKDYMQYVKKYFYKANDGIIHEFIP